MIHVRGLVACPEQSHYLPYLVVDKIARDDKKREQSNVQCTCKQTEQGTKSTRLDYYTSLMFRFAAMGDLGY